MVVKKLATMDDILAGSAITITNIQNKESYKELIYSGLLCNDATFDKKNNNMLIGDPTEGALLLLGRDFLKSIKKS